MARFSAGGTSAGAGSSALPLFSLYAPAGGEIAVREIGVYNTTTTAARFEIASFTTLGTQGAAVTVKKFNDGGIPALGTPFNTHTVGPTIAAGRYGEIPCGAAIGAGTILTWYGENNGLFIPAGTTNGIGLISIGTGQIVDFYIIWDE